MSRARRYRWGDHNSAQRLSPSRVQAVFGALRDRVDGADGAVYVKSTDLELEATNDTLGRCLAALADCPECPLQIEEWGGTPKTWRVKEGDAK